MSGRRQHPPVFDCMGCTPIARLGAMAPPLLASLPAEPHPLSLLPFVLRLLCIALLPLS